MSPTPGTIINGKYRVERLLGEGGMGVVVAARNERLGRDVALKFLHGNLAKRPDILSRFLHEARAAVQLRHPNIVDAIDVDADEHGTPFIVLEMLVGESLSSFLARKRTLSFQETRQILAPAMDGIALAHRQGVVHRDIKPDNIFLHRDGRGDLVPKVLDFGIAKAADAGTNNTATASMLGTPLYMAPEQIHDSKRATSGSDVWSMGVVWFECLSGTLPHAIDPNAPPFQVLTHIVTQKPRSLRQVAGHLPDSVVSLVDRALTSDAGTRYRDMGEFARAVELVGESAAPHVARTEASAPPSRGIASTVALDAARSSGVSPTLPLGAPPLVVAVPTPVHPVNSQISRPARAALWAGLGVAAIAGVVGVAITASYLSDAMSSVAAEPTPRVEPTSAPVVAPGLAVASPVISANRPPISHEPVAPPPVASSTIAAAPHPPPAICRRVADPTGSALNVRGAPGGRSAVVATLGQGTMVETGTRSGSWTEIVTPVAGWVWSEFVVPCDAACVPPRDTIDLAQIVSGLDVRWGAARDATETRCGVATDARRSDCLAAIADIRRVEGPTGVGAGPAQLSYLLDGQGLFEVFAQSDRPADEVIAELEVLLGPATRTEIVTRWDQGTARLAVTAPGGHTSIRAFDRERAAVYSRAAHDCTGQR